MDAPVASTSALVPPPPFAGFGPPAWIFSHNPSDLATEPSASASHFPAPLLLTRPEKRARHGLGARLDLSGDEDASYGPTLRRRGNIRFVPSLGLDHPGKGKAIEKDVAGKGAFVKAVYESVVAELDLPPSPPATPTHASPPDVDLTLDSDSEDDDLVFLDPISRLPIPPSRPALRRPKLRKPLGIHELVAPPTAPPLRLPIQYHFGQHHIGRKILTKQGWKEGNGLGPAPLDGGNDHGLKVPLKPVEKFDRGGLGTGRRAGRPLSKKEIEELRVLEEKEKRRRMGKGERGMTRQAQRDARERRAMLSYMNR